MANTPTRGYGRKERVRRGVQASLGDVGAGAASLTPVMNADEAREWCAALGGGGRVDEQVSDLVAGLHRFGVATEMSCEGHADHGAGYPWVAVSRDAIPRAQAAIASLPELADFAIDLKSGLLAPRDALDLEKKVRESMAYDSWKPKEVFQAVEEYVCKVRLHRSKTVYNALQHTSEFLNQHDPNREANLEWSTPWLQLVPEGIRLELLAEWQEQITAAGDRLLNAKTLSV